MQAGEIGVGEYLRTNVPPSHPNGVPGGPLRFVSVTACRSMAACKTRLTAAVTCG
jgi:hypothetical protein